MKKLIACAVACVASLVSLPLSAVDLQFPNADGKADLGSEASWSPYTWDQIAGKRVYLSNGSVTYVTSSDREFDALYLNNESDTTVTFDIPSDRTITLTTVSGLRLDPSSTQRWHEQNNATTFRGGKWDFNDVGSFVCSETVDCGIGSSLVLDGVVLTNLATFTGFYATRDASIILTNGAHVTAKNGFLTKETSGATYSGRCHFEVTSGSTFAMTGSSYAALMGRTSGSAAYDLLFRVSGRGSSLYWKDAQYLLALQDSPSSPADKSAVRIEDGAVATLETALKCLGDKTRNARLEVLSDAVLNVGDLYWPMNGLARDNVLVVSNATLTCNTLYLGGYTNVVEIIDGNVTASGFTFGRKDGTLVPTGCVVKVKGESTLEITGTKYGLFDAGQGHLFELDGVLGYGFKPFAVGGDGNTVRIKNASTATFPNGFYLEGPSNAVEVLSGSTLTFANTVEFRGVDNRLTISNATVSAKNLDIPKSTGVRGLVELKGGSPRLSGVGVRMTAGATLRVVLPEDGSGDFSEPMVNYSIEAAFDSTCKLEFPNLEAFRKTLTERSVVIPLVYGKSLTVPSEVIASAHLPERTELFVENNTLKLRVRRCAEGLILMVR